jgi:hypothetical protein
MPVRKDLRPLYGPPADWRALSDRVRFVRAGGRCERCRRPHGADVTCLPDGRWHDAAVQLWRDGAGIPVDRPANVELLLARVTRVVLATCHREHDPRLIDDADLAAWCQRCHLIHDAPHHRMQRWLRRRSRDGIADLFLGPYAAAPYPLILGSPSNTFDGSP